jgi:hypothetical protein
LYLNSIPIARNDGRRPSESVEAGGTGKARLEDDPMREPERVLLLSEITPKWESICQIYGVHPTFISRESALAAQIALLTDYAEAVNRYLMKIVRDPDASADVFLEFWQRLKMGAFLKADPDRGDFDRYIKKSLRRFAYRRLKKRPPVEKQINPGHEPIAPTSGPDIVQLRRDVVSCAWDSLMGFYEGTGKPHGHVIRLRVDHPGLTSAEMAERLSVLLRKEISADRVRKLLSVARPKFAGYLLDEVKASLDDPTDALVEQESINLGLHVFFRKARTRRRDHGKPRGAGVAGAADRPARGRKKSTGPRHNLMG